MDSSNTLRDLLIAKANEARKLAADLNSKPAAAYLADPSLQRMAYAMAAKCDHFLEAAEIVTAALQQPAAEPVGDWVMVPREPTPEQAVAGAHVHDQRPSEAVQTYRAMNAAAPRPPEPVAISRDEIETLQVGLDMIRRQADYWVSYNTEKRAKEGLASNDDTNLITPPWWPSHGQLRAWSEVLAKAGQLLAPPVVLEVGGEKGSALSQSCANGSPDPILTDGQHSDGRSAADYAIEHGGYLARSVEGFLDLIGREAVFDEDVEQYRREEVSDHLSAMRSAVYEFDKRATRAKALSGAQRSELSPQAPDDQNPHPHKGEAS